MRSRGVFRHGGAQVAWIALLAFILGGVGWWGQSAWREARSYRQQVDLKYREWQSLTRSVPVPTETTAETISAELVQAEQVRQALRAELSGNGDGARRLPVTPVPANGTDFFFDLAAFTERTRARAESRGVILEQDERFGFSEYAHGGPVGELVSSVFRQRLIIEQLIGALLEAQPRGLLLVQREAILSSTTTARANDDAMIMPPLRSLRVEGLVTAMGFRLGFTGHTSTLRVFLAELESLGLPVAVRLIEAEPAVIEGELMKDAPAPLVARGLTKFTVTLEYLELEPSTPSDT